MSYVPSDSGHYTGHGSCVDDQSVSIFSLRLYYDRNADHTVQYVILIEYLTVVMLVTHRELREAAEKLRERFHGIITMEHLHLHIYVSAAPCTERLKYSAMATVHLILIFSPSFSSSVFQREVSAF